MFKAIHKTLPHNLQLHLTLYSTNTRQENKCKQQYARTTKKQNIIFLQVV